MIHANTVFLLIRLLCCSGSALAAETKAGGRRGENYPAPLRANSSGSVGGLSVELSPRPFPLLPPTLCLLLVLSFSIFPSAVPLLPLCQQAPKVSSSVLSSVPVHVPGLHCVPLPRVHVQDMPRGHFEGALKGFVGAALELGVCKLQ